MQDRDNLGQGEASPIEAALAYARRGWAVFPLAPGSKVPTGGSRGCLDATTDEATIRRWFLGQPRANVGIATGRASGLYVVDVDAPSHEIMPRLGTTLIARTRAAGWHYVYALPLDDDGQPMRLPNTNQRGANALAEHVDTRGDGGYIVAWPSVIVEEREGAAPVVGRYEWINEVEPAPLPAWVLDRVKPRELSAVAGKAILDLRRPTSSSYGGAALERECQEVAKAGEGGRNHQLNASAYTLGRLVLGGHLSRADVEDGLLAAARACGLPEGEARRTIASGLRGASKGGPRHPLQRTWQDPLGGRDITLDPPGGSIGVTHAGPGVEGGGLALVPDGIETPQDDCDTPMDPADMTDEEGDAWREAILEEVRALGGLCESYPAWVLRGADYRQPGLTLASLLVLGGAMLGRRLVYRRMLTGIYCVALADSAAGKGRPQACLDRVLSECWHRLRGPSSFSSSVSLTNSIQDATNNGVAMALILDEYGMQLAAMIGPRASAHRQDIKAILTEVATKGTGTWSPSKSLAQGGKAPRIFAPCLAILGSTTPASLHGVLTGLEVADGFAGRHLWLQGQNTLPEWQDPDDTGGDDAVPGEVAQAVAVMRQRHEAWVDALPIDAGAGGAVADAPLRLYQPMTMMETPEAARELADYRLACDRERRDARRPTVPPSVLGRAPEYAARVAAILAGLSQPDAEVPTVHAGHVQVAISIADESARCLGRSLAVHARPSWDDHEGQLEAVLRVLATLGGEASRSQILRSCRKLSARQVAEALARLEEEGKAVVHPGGGSTATVVRLLKGPKKKTQGKQTAAKTKT